LEETSSSLEEMASMTKRNSDNAQTAKDLANETRQAADAGANDMRDMSTAMDEIKKSSDDISKIIKTIDEIAFQTNILALNAAVEAARAGEAGMGFAVVADEVRALAQRSAQAAKETAEKIQDAVNKSEQGVQISAKVGQSLQEMVEKARKVDELVAEIATASREQTQGIGQVNTAVTQMDKVTQSNAANAEETASAAEELSAQAEEMRGVVQDLVAMVDGVASHQIRRNGSVSSVPQSQPKQPVARPPQSKAHLAEQYLQKSQQASGEAQRENTPSLGAGQPPQRMDLSRKSKEAIPMEGDFQDF
jgi:methyl-accepting chemotaxis protein